MASNTSILRDLTEKELLKHIFGNYRNDFQRSNLTDGPLLLMLFITKEVLLLIAIILGFYYYKLIVNANAIIMNIDNAKGTDSEKQFIKAQKALTFRAYSYLMLN